MEPGQPVAKLRTNMSVVSEESDELHQQVPKRKCNRVCNDPLRLQLLIDRSPGQLFEHRTFEVAQLEHWCGTLRLR